MWANIKHLLDAVIPVAEASSVRLALHPEDPPVLQPLGGVGHVTSTLDQYEKIFELTGKLSQSELANISSFAKTFSDNMFIKDGNRGEHREIPEAKFFGEDAETAGAALWRATRALARPGRPTLARSTPGTAGGWAPAPAAPDGDHPTGDHPSLPNEAE